MAKAEMTIRAEVDLSDESKALLAEIRDRLPELPARSPGARPPLRGMKVGARQAILAMLATLDAWVEGARSNHEACALPVKRAAIAALAVAVILSGGACDRRHGSTKPPPPPSADDKFKKDCILKGGQPVIVHSNGKTTRTCHFPIG